MTVVSDDQPDLGYGTVNVYRTGRAVKIELNRPERMNAWSGVARCARPRPTIMFARSC
jgi:hypothetical protein